MLESERLSIAAHLHNLLRRKLGRVTDIEWMTRNDEYAHEIVRLSLSQPEHTDLQAMGLRLQALLPATQTRAALPAVNPTPGGGPPGASRYVRSLR